MGLNDPDTPRSQYYVSIVLLIERPVCAVISVLSVVCWTSFGFLCVILMVFHSSSFMIIYTYSRATGFDAFNEVFHVLYLHNEADSDKCETFLICIWK